MISPKSPQHRVIQALRVAAAAAITLVVAEWWHLPHANLAVWSTHMIMSSYTHTVFQKGLERIGGRAVGILLGTLLVGFVGELTPLVLVLEVAGMLGFFYAHFCGRLAYTYMNAGIYLNGIVMMNTAGLDSAWVNGGWMVLALALGIGVAYLVMWATWGEDDFSIDPGPGRLFPLRGEPLSRAAQMVASMLVAQYVFFALDMPADSNTYALFLLSVVPDLQSMIANNRVFTGGIWSASVAAVPTYLLMNRLPHFPLFVAVIASFLFVASWVAQSPGRIKYVGTEFGNIYPLLVVVPYEQVLTPASTLYNVIALYVFTAIAFVLGYLWVALGLVSNQPPGAHLPAPRGAGGDQK